MTAPTSMASAPGLPAPPPATTRRPRTTLVILRIIVALTTLQILAQPVLAGAYLQGEFDALGLHSNNALLILPMMLVQIGVALAYWLAGRGPVFPVLISFGMFLALAVQFTVGFSRTLAIHIPLGVAIVVATVLSASWVFSRRASQARTPRATRPPRVVRTERAS